jgi:hypothetical protein
VFTPLWEVAMPPLARARRRAASAVGALLITALALPPLAWADVTANPDPSGLPGSSKLQKLLDGLYSWALILALGALVISALVWALGSHSQNYGAAHAGKRGVVVAALAALLIGAGPTIVNFFYRAGGG